MNKIDLKMLLADQEATGDVLAAMLGVERCPDGNVCHANAIGLFLEKHGCQTFAELEELLKGSTHG